MSRQEMQLRFAARLRALPAWARMTYTGPDGPVTYHMCRFCHNSAYRVALWKYGVRHYICDHCKREKEKVA